RVRSTAPPAAFRLGRRGDDLVRILGDDGGDIDFGRRRRDRFGQDDGFLGQNLLDRLLDAGGHGGRDVQLGRDRDRLLGLCGSLSLGSDRLGGGGFGLLLGGDLVQLLGDGRGDLAAHAATLGRLDGLQHRDGLGRRFGRTVRRFFVDHHGDGRVGRADRRQAFVDGAILDLGLMRHLAPAATTTATTARAAVAAFALGRLFGVNIARLVAALGVILGDAFGAHRRRVDRVEPDIGVLQRRRTAAHPGEDVALAFLANPATAAAAPATATAAPVVIVVCDDGFGFILPTSAATATAATAATAVIVLFLTSAAFV